jgi:hypothetical protein
MRAHHATTFDAKSTIPFDHYWTRRGVDRMCPNQNGHPPTGTPYYYDSLSTQSTTISDIKGTD